jgi:hypothetical protein
MTRITRRDALRVAGGAGAAGLAAAASHPVTAEAAEAARKRVRARLDQQTYRPGDRMVLTVRGALPTGSRLVVRDSAGQVWSRVHGHGRRWESVAGAAGTGAVTVAARRSDGRVAAAGRYRFTVRYRISSATTAQLGAGATLIGMSAPADQWDRRVAEVGAGLGARRIFADLSQGADSQMKLVEASHAAGLLPVISYKVGGDIAGAISGKYDAAAAAAATRLAAFGRPTAVTFWHEPSPDVSGADYAAASRRLLPVFKRGELRVGPLLNGWLLDNQSDLLATYTPSDLFGLWDWFGMDTYEAGSAAKPGAAKPAGRVPALKAFMNARGYDLPIGVGEYNGYSGTTIAACGEALLATPGVWFGCMWNATGGKGLVLTGDRLTAFRSTLADPRNARVAQGAPTA